jgi:hypothetical protein
MEIQFRNNLDRPRWTRHLTRRRKLVLGVALALLLIPSLIVLAHHLPFTDVPTSGPLHDAVAAIYGAGITAGTSSTTYSPNDPVTRAQMALFMQRGFPRVAHNSGTDVTLNSIWQDLAVVTIHTGGVPGQTGFVKLDASISAYPLFTTGCPCEVNFHILQDGGNSSVRYYATVAGLPGSVGGGVTWALPVPTASTQTFRLQMLLNGSAGATIAGRGALTALYVPFGNTGANALAAQPGEGPEQR